jgi:phenylacetate-CoA ligase
MIWDKVNEMMPREDLRKKQGENLKKLVDKIYEKVPFYKRKMDEAGVKPSDIKDISDITKLPFTTKDEMREVYPLGLLAVEQNNIREIHASSGTTGKPVIDAYTDKDLDIWSETMARTLSMGGCSSDDVVQNAYGYGLFTGGLGSHYGARRIGATVIPISGGNTRRQLSMMQDCGRGRHRHFEAPSEIWHVWS